MKKIALFLTLLLLVTASCSKNERNEKKFLKGILSESFEESAAANQEFSLWLSSDEGTMTYDFPLMHEQIGLKVATSPDSVVRCYSWCLDRSSENPKYDNVIQWIAQGRMVAFSGTLDYLLAGRKNDLKKMSSFGHSIDTIFEITSGNHPVYMIAQSFIYDGKKRKAYVSAAYINGVRLMLLPNFFDGIEFAGNNVFIDDGSTPISDLFKWDEKSKRFYAYQTDDSSKLIPGKYTIFELGSERFSRLPEEEQQQ